MKLRIKIVPLLLAFALILSSMVGCSSSDGQTQPQSSANVTQESTPTPTVDYSNMTIEEQMAEDAKNPITMTLTYPTDTPPDADSPILAEFAKRTGITFELNPIPGEPHEKLGMMLASNSLSDIMIVPNDQMASLYKQSDQILDLQPLLEKNAPTMASMLSADVNFNLLKYMKEPDGRLLNIIQDVELRRSADEELLEDPNDSNKDNVWMPWATALYVLFPDIDTYAGKKITNLDEWYQAMAAYKAQNPRNYPTTMCSEYGEWTLYAFAQMYGYKVETIAGTNLITKDGVTYQSLARLPEAIDSMKFLNRLYKDGLMDPDGPIQNKDAFLEKMSTGRVFSFFGWWEKMYDANEALDINDATNGMVYIPQNVKGTGVSQRWEYNTAYIGDNCMMVTKNNPDPDRYFRFLEYIYSDEGGTLNGWGIEGEHYTVDSDGLKTPTLDFSVVVPSKIGLNFFHSIIPKPMYLTTGQPSSSMFMVYNEDEISDVLTEVKNSKYNYFRDFGGNYFVDLSTINIMLPVDSEESLTVAKIRTPINDMVCQAMVADSEEEIIKIYNDTIALLESHGLSKLEKTLQDSITAQKR